MIEMEHGGAPWWSQFVDLDLQLGIATHVNQNTVGQWEVSHWDRPLTGTWSGQEPDWYSIDPCNLLDLSIVRGRERWIDRFGASSAGFAFRDPDGRLSWDAGDNQELLEVRPGREVRVSARVVPSGNEYPVWRGFIENIEDEFAPSNVPIAKFTAQDGYAQLSHIDPGEGPIVGTGETSDARIHRLLDIADWPNEWRDIQFGLITVQGTNTARPIADDMGITADSEGGAVFSDREGNIVYRNRDWLRTDPHSQDVQVIIGGPSIPDIPAQPPHSYLDLNVLGDGASTPNPGTVLPGPLQVAAWVALDDYSSGAIQPLVTQNNSGVLRWRLDLTATGQLRFAWHTGTVAATRSTPVLPFANGTKVWLRATLVLDDGNGNNVCTFEYSTENTVTPTTWTQLAAPTVTAGTTTIAALASPLWVGRDIQGAGAVGVGQFFAARVTNGATVLANPNFSNVEPGTTTVTDSAGHVFTLAGSATIAGTPSTPAIPGEEHVCAASYRTERNGNDIANDIGVAKAGGTIQRFVDDDSIATYRRRTYQRTDFVCETDAQVATLGRRILQARASGQVRLPSLTITPTDKANEWEFVCAVDYGWKIEVRYPGVGGPDTGWTRTMFVQGISHRITPSAWETELRVDDAVVSMADTWDGRHGWDQALWSEVV